MIVIVDPRTEVSEAYKSTLSREGYTVVSFDPQEFINWFHASSSVDLKSVEAVVLGECESREQITRNLKRKLEVPAIALSDVTALEMTLKLFEAGIDDVVRKPVHAREIIARIGAIRRRQGSEKNGLWEADNLVIHGDGRDIEVNGMAFSLPRRELRILEYLASCYGRRVSRTQIFGAVYGVFEEDVEECVVESHISKLRKKLKAALGYDPIDTQRFIGYQLVCRQAMAA